jgi:hypothetical protein
VAKLKQQVLRSQKMGCLESKGYAALLQSPNHQSCSCRQLLLLLLLHHLLLLLHLGWNHPMYCLNCQLALLFLQPLLL